MTRPADPSLYLDEELDITPTEEEGGRFVVEARKTCDARWTAALAAHLGHLGMTVEVKPADIEGVEEKAG